MRCRVCPPAPARPQRFTPLRVAALGLLAAPASALANPIPAAADTLVTAVADLEILDFYAVDLPADILVGQAAEVKLRTIITSHGPSSPMDVAHTTAGGVLTLTDVSQVVGGVSVDEMREVEEVLALTCLSGSTYGLSVTTEIQPARPDDTDPDLGNNQETLDLTVQCVTQVVINIRPGGFPNSVAPAKPGLVAVAVLTTAADEYGLPAAFDAAAIDPLSVRFGSPAVLKAGGGAREAHAEGHVEHSVELDEVNVDGDEDMMLHFRSEASGVTDGDAQACVKGQWVDELGFAHAFFGCDAITHLPR